MGKHPVRSACAILWLGAILSLSAAPQVKVGLGHSAAVKAVAFSGDGRFLLSAAIDRSIKLWETATGRELRTIRTGDDSFVLDSITFTPDGKAAILWPMASPTTVWDLATGLELEPPYLSGKASRARQQTFYSGDRRTAFVRSGLDNPSLEVWDVATGRMRKSFPRHPSGAGEKLVASMDGRLILALPWNRPHAPRSLTVWDTLTGRKVATLAGHALAVPDAAFAPDGRSVLTASEDKTLKLWDAATGRLLRTFRGHGGWVACVAFSPDGKHALSGSWDHSLKLWDVATGTVLRTLEGHGDGVDAVAFSPDGSMALSGSSDHTLKLWDLATGRELRTLASPSGPVEHLALSGGRLIASQGNLVPRPEPEGGPGSGRISTGLLRRMKSWTFPAGEVGFMCPSEVECLAQAPDGKTLLTSGGSGPLVLRDARTGEPLRTFQDPGESYFVNALAFSPDGGQAFTGASRGPVKVWDVASGRPLRSLAQPPDCDEPALFSPDGAWALFIPEEPPDAVRYPLVLMDLATGHTLRTLPGHAEKIRKAAFSPDGKLLLTASFGNVLKLWDLAGGRSLRPPEGIVEEVTAILFSQDGSTVVLGCQDGTLKSWGLVSGQPMRTFRGHGDAITALALARDGATLYSGSRDGTIRTWDTADGRELTATMVDNAGEWLTWTPQGDFEGTPKAARDYVYIVDGSSTLAMDQAYGVYYRPDRVQAAFLNRSGKPGPERINLAGLIQEGLAPVVEFAVQGGAATARDLEVIVRVKPGPGGVGRLTIFLDGTPMVVAEDSRGLKLQGGTPADPVREFRGSVTLHSGKNLLEASAFNAAGTIESARAAMEVTWAGKGGDPRLFVLAVAIDAYRDGELRLKYPVADARSLEAAFTRGSPGLFLPGLVRSLYDKEATRMGIGAAFDELAALVGPDDVFLLYLAGHGVAFEEDGDYYFLPVDFRFTGKEAIAASGLSKGFIVDHLARIKASKSILLFDTCNSGAFLAGGSRGISEKTALDRLKRAMGRATVVASANDQSAMEGYEGHGVFTWALLEGLSGKADSNQDGFVTVTELTSYVENLVPDITYKKWGYEQIPQKELPREDFPIAKMPR